MSGVSDSIPKNIASSVSQKISQSGVQGNNSIIIAQNLITENNILIITENNVKIIKE